MQKLSSLQKVLSLLALISLGLGLIWLETLNPSQPNAYLPSQHGEPDYVITQAEVYRYNSLGQKIQTLKAKEAVSYPEKNLIEFTQPKIWQFNQGQATWLLEADTGIHLQATAKQQEITQLNTNVVLTPLNPTSAYTPQLFTQSLQLNHLTNLASTTSPVSLLSPKGKTLGKGLLVDFNQETAIIESQVKGTYLPPSASALPTSPELPSQL